jgi:tetratricopeptide (TPR) repeat protein
MIVPAPVAAFLAVLHVCAVASAAKPPAASTLVGQVEQALGASEGRVARLEARFGAADPGSAAIRLQTRINDGLVFHQLREYTRAAILLSDVVDDEVNKRHPGYKDALFYLADSLYKNRNYLGAERHFRGILDGGHRQYFQDALLRLIELSFVTGRYSGVDDYYARLRSLSGAAPQPKVMYVHAKSLYFRNRLADAEREFLAVSRDDPHYLPARYFAGISQVRQGQYKEAIPYFEEVLGLQPADEDQERIVEMANLSLGRLYYELGESGKAIDRYQEIPRNSDVFDNALYEVCWVYVKKKEYAKALRSLDILLLAMPDSSFAPEAKLVKGNLQLRLARYEEATDTFNEVVGKFSPVRDELDQILREHADPEAYFRQLVGENLKRFDVSVVLPPLAAAWVKTETDVERALMVVGDLETAEKDVSESMGIVERLENALEADNRIEIFPAMHQGWAEALETENSTVQLNRKLNDAEKALVWDIASPAEREEWNRLSAERETVEQDFQAIPKTAERLAMRESKVEEAYRKLEKKAFKLGFQIDAIQAQLVAIDKWVTDTKDKRTAESSERHIGDSVVQQRAELEALYGELRALAKTIEFERARVGLGDAVTREEDKVKEDYAKMLDTEAGLLSRLRARASAKAQALLARVDACRQRIRALEDRTRRFYKRIALVVDERVRELEIRVKVERQRLAEFARRVTGYEGMSENLAGRIALENFRTVRGKFHDIVLKADVGMIDVAWARKEDTTITIDELLNERKDKFKTLSEDYEELRKEGRGGAQ